jgi:hypothetical protein
MHAKFRLVSKGHRIDTLWGSEEGFRWEEVGDDESVGLVAFQMTQQRKFNFMHLHFDLGVKGFQRALLPASIHTSWIVSN